MPLYNKYCNRCGAPFSTVNPDTYRCDACRIIGAQEEAEQRAADRERERESQIRWNSLSAEERAAELAERERIRQIPYTPSIWETLGNIISFIFYALIAYYIAWPMLSIAGQFAWFVLTMPF